MHLEYVAQEMDSLSRWFPEVLLTFLVGYFIGSISFPRLAVSLVTKQKNLKIPDDKSTIRTKFGADRASIILGAKSGILMGILDMLKVAMPMIYVKFLLYPGELHYLIISIAGLVGHNWPIYYRFNGGRGFSVILSSLFIVDWVGAIIVLFLGLLLGMGIFKNLMMAYMNWLWLMVPWLWLRTYNYIYVLYSVVLIMIFFITTIPEIKAFMKYSREGNLGGFFEPGLYDSSPRWRGMKKMQERVNNLGVWRFVIVAIAFIAIVLIFPRLPPV